VLRVIAQHRLAQQQFQTPTAMEPEVALVMATLARVRKSSRVLDPFVGGGSLLLAAALLGAKEVVGVDAAAELLGEGAPARTATLDAFAALADGPARQALMMMMAADSGGQAVLPKPPSPALFLADIRDYEMEEHAAIFRQAYYEAICADPPYSIKEKVRGAAAVNHDPAPDSGERADVTAIIATLLRVAAHVLAPGGRLVFFLPAWGRHGLEAPGLTGRSRGTTTPPPLDAEDALALASSWGHWNARILAEQSVLGGLPAMGLRIVGAQPQVFTRSFLRWLVCIEKNM
jgi:SAM-dependent methyltransferase